MSFTPQFDPVVAKDTPGTKYLPQTGHILSLPQGTGTDSESFMMYCGRVHLQAYGNVNSIGNLFLGVNKAFQDVGEFSWDDKSNWPDAADAFFNPKFYMTDEELGDANWDEYAWHNWFTSAPVVVDSGTGVGPKIIVPGKGGIGNMSGDEKRSAKAAFLKTKAAKIKTPLYPA